VQYARPPQHLHVSTVHATVVGAGGWLCYPARRKICKEHPCCKSSLVSLCSLTQRGSNKALRSARTSEDLKTCAFMGNPDCRQESYVNGTCLKNKSDSFYAIPQNCIRQLLKRPNYAKAAFSLLCLLICQGNSGYRSHRGHHLSNFRPTSLCSQSQISWQRPCSNACKRSIHR
jgi:hypothetical protein